jgi:hypothetical protein
MGFYTIYNMVINYTRGLANIRMNTACKSEKTKEKLERKE